MNQEIKPHTLWQSVALHLVPGALLTAFYFLIAPLVMRAGYPPLAALFLSILVVLIPVELGVLYREGRKRNGRLSLDGVVLNREPIPPLQFLYIVPLLLLWSAAAFILLAPVDNWLMRTLFAWMPVWSAPDAFMTSASQYPGLSWQVTAVFGLILNGFAGPAVEELYFRGYLMPRIPASPRWSPLINAMLFSLYHFFSPWQFITRIVALIVPVYTVARRRNLYLGMWMHCLLNTIGMLLLAAQVL